NRIERLTNELEELKKEKEGLDSKLIVYSPPKKDMSWIRLPEFADDTITDYSRPSLSIGSNSSDLQNCDSSVSENGESSESIMSKPIIKFVKAADSLTVIKTNKNETVRKPSVKYVEWYVSFGQGGGKITGKGTKDAESQDVKKYVSSLRYSALPN
nr:hypothetical protein [Tanacetum cinerariifolium]